MSDLPVFTRTADERVANLEAALKKVSDYTGRLEAQLAAAEQQIDGLQNHARKVQAKLAAAEARYGELLMRVAQCVPGETRHETALRIIRQHGAVDSAPGQPQQENRP